jgi:hypothetical protein
MPAKNKTRRNTTRGILRKRNARKKTNKNKRVRFDLKGGCGCSLMSGGNGVIQPCPSCQTFSGGCSNCGRKQCKCKQRGGYQVGQDFLNVNRVIGHNISSAWNTLRGIPSTPNPLPHFQTKTQI